MAMATIEEIRKAQRAEGVAKILSIGTATPSNCISQCDNSMIKKRYFYMTEEMFKENPSMCTYMAPSLDARQDMTVKGVHKLGKETAAKAIKEWGQPKSKITHLIFCTSSSVDMPGADYQLTKLLALTPSFKRTMIYQQGCFAGGTSLRLAKDLAENNKGARVLVVCSENTALYFHGVSDTNLDTLVAAKLFADGAGAAIGATEAHLREAGLTLQLPKNIPSLISNNIEKSVAEAFSPVGTITNWNSLFYVAHLGGRAVIDQLEAKLSLKKHKLRASRHVLSEYGNMSSASVFFVLDEMRNKSVEEGKPTTSEGLEWGVLLGFGPGLTVETIVLHSTIPIKPSH
ncbi:hypothetical protein CRYUN_Cryun08bG0100600 [Craigia yunnanensis]